MHGPCIRIATFATSSYYQPYADRQTANLNTIGFQPVESGFFNFPNAGFRQHRPAAAYGTGCPAPDPRGCNKGEALTGFAFT